MEFGLLAKLFNLVLAQAAAVGDGNFLLLAGALVLGADIEYAVRVDVESDFDLRQAPRSRRDAVEAESADKLVVLAIGRSPCSTRMSTASWLSA